MHPDAHYDPRFLKALRGSVRKSLPPPASRQWWRVSIALLVSLFLLFVLVVILTLLGYTAVSAPPIAAAFGLFFAAIVAAPPSGQSNLAVFFGAFAQYPAEPRHALHWLRRMEAATVCAFLLLPLLGGVFHLIASRSGADSWLPVLSTAIAAGLMISGAYALLHFLPGGRVLRGAAFVLCLGTFIALKMGSTSAGVVQILNPIAWPLLALQNPDDSAALLRATTGCAGSVLVLIAAWRSLPRHAGRYLRIFNPGEEALQSSAPRRTFTLRIPGLFDSAEKSAGLGFWERIIQRTLTPQQRALAELARLPGAPSLGRLFFRCVLRLGLTVGGVVALGFFLPETAALIGGIALTGVISKTLYRTPAADGFPFHPLTHTRPQAGGQELLPLALLPVPWSAVSRLFLKSLWPRCVLVGCLFLPLGAVCDFLLHRWSSPPATGLPVTTGALLVTVFGGTYAVLSFSHELASQAGALRSANWRGAFRWLALLTLHVTAFIAGLAAIPLAILAWVRPHYWPWTAGISSLSLLSAAAAHLHLLRLLQRGDLDLWKIPTPSRRLLT